MPREPVGGGRVNVTITSDAEARLWGLIRAVDTEIGGWGYAFADGEAITWSKTFLVPQIATHSEVDFEATGGDIAAIERAAEDGVLNQPDFVWVSWHSHHTMKPFWSKTDDKRIAAMRQAGVTRLVSFVGCHDGSYRLRVDVFDVEAHGIRIPQVTLDELDLHSDPDDEFAADIMREVAVNLRKPAPKQTFLPAPKKQAADPRMHNVEEAFVIRELMEANFTYWEATDLIHEEGLDAVKELVRAGITAEDLYGLPVGFSDD